MRTLDRIDKGLKKIVSDLSGGGPYQPPAAGTPTCRETYESCYEPADLVTLLWRALPARRAFDVLAGVIGPTLLRAGDKRPLASLGEVRAWARGEAEVDTLERALSEARQAYRELNHVVEFSAASAAVALAGAALSYCCDRASWSVLGDLQGALWATQAAILAGARKADLVGALGVQIYQCERIRAEVPWGEVERGLAEDAERQGLDGGERGQAGVEEGAVVVGEGVEGGAVGDQAIKS